MNPATANLGSLVKEQLIGNDNKDYVMLTYHTGLSANDPFNDINSSDPSARAAFYNVDQITSVIDGIRGGVTTESKSGDLTWKEIDLVISSLGDPGFEIFSDC